MMVPTHFPFNKTLLFRSLRARRHRIAGLPAAPSMAVPHVT
jgi:hypothetical protein